jgi:pimeloyl-ACP methyl ester carboxylesterase
MIKSHEIKGGGGVQLHVVEAGNPKGRAIFYLHGLSQCWLQWSRQLNSDLANDHRLVAMDMRGHGLSDTPLQGYDDSKLWAEDVNAVINSLSLENPVLCGWSYGPLLILDYIRHFGEDHIGGIQFVGAATKLGSDDAIAVLTPEFLSLLPGLFSTDVRESVSTLQPFLRLCFAREPAAEELFLMLGYSVSVPPYVRQALLSRSLNNDDILPKIRKPVLITHGASDAIVKPAAVGLQKASMAHAVVQMMDNAGHAAFWDDAPNFNRRQREFCESLTR